MSSQSIKHLIFDLGGVIINLDTALTIKAFAELTNKSIDRVIEFSTSHSGFHAYEKGEISNSEFRDVIREMAEREITNEQIDLAWNAMILDLPLERIQLLQQLKKDYSIYLLSNTNFIHMDRVNEVRSEAGHPEFNTLFHQDYYSHIMGKRKPDAAIFEQVIQEQNLNPEHTLFLDDNLANIEGASRLGLQTLHVTSPLVMMEYFNNGR
ncbi:HAD family hydrolase [Fulvivirga lutea]|uniref:HAD family phosphatase n=1 Tax=Fulvivirga lutea TaxID=2810512 RepID=A0A974WJ92_9BACT|nr:HAD family phosphatase [Fulvivirga lutea]QSE99210.1 HAD family phosphatase [Fulvivirga lutea]